MSDPRAFVVHVPWLLKLEGGDQSGRDDITHIGGSRSPEKVRIHLVLLSTGIPSQNGMVSSVDKSMDEVENHAGSIVSCGVHMA